METKIEIRNYKNIKNIKIDNVLFESNNNKKYYVNVKNAVDVIFEVKIECGYLYSKVNIKDGKKILECLGFWPGPESIFFYKNINDIDNVVLNTELW